MFKIQHYIFLLLIMFFNIPCCFAANIQEMKVYCSEKRPSVSFPFAGPLEVFSNPEFEEAYISKDMVNFNSYQFYYKKINRSVKPKEYLDLIRKERIRSANATLIKSKIFKTGSKTVSTYGYQYSTANTKKLSYVKSVIDKGVYYSWAVQSYDGRSNFSADYIFNNYSKYLTDDGNYCQPQGKPLAPSAESIEHYNQRMQNDNRPGRMYDGSEYSYLKAAPGAAEKIFTSPVPPYK